MQYPRPGSPYCTPIKSDGTVLAVGAAGVATLASSATYYYPVGGESSPLNSVWIKWDNVLNAVFTVEDTNARSEDVTSYDATAGNWIQENPSTAYVGVTGGAVSSLTITVALTTAGGCLIHLGNTGARRTRLKVVVTTGGVVAVGCHGKA